MSRRPITIARSAFPTLTEAQWQTLRWMPFVATALFSLVMSAVAPDGRRPFDFDWSLSAAALEFSIVKLPHIGATAILACLGVLATGRQRWPLALALTVLTGAGWELCQTTVIGHYARLSDLAPDTLGAFIGSILGAASLWAVELSPHDDRRR
jgi:VanZ family protein